MRIKENCSSCAYCAEFTSPPSPGGPDDGVTCLNPRMAELLGPDFVEEYLNSNGRLNLWRVERVSPDAECDHAECDHWASRDGIALESMPNAKLVMDPTALQVGDLIASQWYGNPAYYVGLVCSCAGRTVLWIGESPRWLSEVHHVVLLAEGPRHQPPAHEHVEGLRRVAITIMKRRPNSELIKIDLDAIVISKIGSEQEIEEMVLEAEQHGNDGTSRIHMFYS